MARPAPFARLPVLFGVVHVRPLPGAPRWAGSMAEVVARARADVTAYRAAGFHGVIVENFGDAPFFAGAVPPETVAGLATVLAEVREAAGPMLRGANVLRNDARAALALAAAAEFDLARVNVLAGATVTDQGLLQSDAALVLRDRARLAPRVAIAADVRVKHARPLAPGPLAEEAQDLVERAGADALVVTGARTGAAAALADLEVAGGVSGHPPPRGLGRHGRDGGSPPRAMRRRDRRHLRETRRGHARSRRPAPRPRVRPRGELTRLALAHAEDRPPGPSG